MRDVCECGLISAMYSIFIAIPFIALGLWLLNRENAKDPRVRSPWAVLSAVLSLVMGSAVLLVFLIVMFL